MPTKIKELMTPQVQTCPSTATVKEAAQVMKSSDIGDVIVLDESNQICGIVTDRDITIRVVAEGKDPNTIRLDDVCSKDLTTLTPDSTVGEAVELMRNKAVRRLPVVENGKPVGIISIGDLAVERDRDSALADISAAPPND